MVPLCDDHAADCPPADQLRRVAQGIAAPRRGVGARTASRRLRRYCRQRFEALLATPEEQADLARIDLPSTEADMESIRARGNPLPSSNEVREDGIQLPGNIWLDPRADQATSRPWATSISSRFSERGAWGWCSGPWTARLVVKSP